MRRSLIATLLLLGLTRTASAAVPAGFDERTFSSSALNPVTGAAWAPDGSGRLFVLLKTGAIRVVRTANGLPVTSQGSALATTTFATEPAVHTNAECGLLGIAFDPNYVVNRYLYVLVTVSASEQQIIRYTDVGGGATAAGTGAERTVLIAQLPTKGGTHVGGGLAIGGDGKLYFSTGDLSDGSGVNADLTSLASKVGRANLDGSPANDNPFFDGVGPNNEYIWARGLRNPFGLFRQPSTGALWTTVAGTSYEQAFLLGPRAHAGYSAYENNQPAQNDYITPKIAYRTNGVDVRNITSVARIGGILTVTTVAEHRFRVGQPIGLSGFDSNPSFNGDVYVASVPSATTFTAAQAGNDAGLGPGGVATTKDVGGAITRGTFYDATAFPPEYRGNLFFGDFNSAALVRATLSAGNEIQRVDVWGTGFSSNIQVTTGDDGALYTLGYTSGLLRRVTSTATTPRIVIGNVTPRVLEGGRAVFSVSLATAPTANVTVTTARSGGDTDIDVLSGSTLTFTPTDWAQPRPVALAAAWDVDTAVDLTTFDVSAPGFTTEQVTARSIERSGSRLVVSSNVVNVPEDGQASLTVAWSGPLAKTTTVAIRRTHGDEDLTIVDTATLTFTPANAQAPQTVTFAAASDADSEGGRAEVAIASSLDSVAVTLVEVDDDAPPPDAGDAGLIDAGTTDAATVDAAIPGVDASVGSDAGGSDAVDPDAPEDGGCNCNVPGSSASGALWIVPALLLRRRRRK